MRRCLSLRANIANAPEMSHIEIYNMDQLSTLSILDMVFEKAQKRGIPYEITITKPLIGLVINKPLARILFYSFHFDSHIVVNTSLILHPNP